MTFARLTRGDAIAWLAALCLLAFTAIDWWGTHLGDEYRALQSEASSQTGVVAQGAAAQTEQDARFAAQAQERNAWQAGHLVDKLILAVLLAAALAATVAAVARVSGRRFDVPWTPSALAAALALLGALLLAYRLANEPGFDSVTTVKSGVLLSLAACGVLGAGAGAAFQRELDGTAYRDEPGPEPAAPEQQPGEPRPGATA